MSSSHLEPDARHTSKKTRNKRVSRRKKQVPSAPSSQPTPQAPAELNAMLGYGTSSSFPLFIAGIVSLEGVS